MKIEVLNIIPADMPIQEIILNVIHELTHIDFESVRDENKIELNKIFLGEKLDIKITN